MSTAPGSLPTPQASAQPAEAKRSLFKQMLESGQIKVQPLTFPQRELWEVSPVAAGDVANHVCCVIETRGKVTPKDGAGALKLVVDRQEALRTSILPGKERPLQLVRSEVEPNLTFHELTPEQSRPEAVAELEQQIFRTPFDIMQGPLFRVDLVRRSEDDHLLVFSIHHSIGDGWTLGVFVQELCLAYVQIIRGVRTPLPALPMSYNAWGAAERAYWTPAELKSRLDFWKPHLAGYQRLWDRFEGPGTAAGCPTRWITHLSPELSKAVRDLARRCGATLFSTLLGAFQIALARWSGSNDTMVGSPVANRSKTAVNETIGSFAGIVPLRGEVDPRKTFAASVRATHQTTIDGFANAMPFAELAAAVGDPGRPGHNPVFEVRFALQNHPVPDVALPGLSAKLHMRATGTARFHIACEVTEQDDQLEVVWLYRPQHFPQDEIERLRNLYQTVLTNACRSSETRFADLCS